MLGLGVIEESNSSWSSPVTLVQKGPKNRLCLDARKVNSWTIKDAYLLPHIEGLLSRLQETYYISAIDLPDVVTVEEFNRQRKDTRGRYEDGQGCRGQYMRWCAISVDKE